MTEKRKERNPDARVDQIFRTLRAMIDRAEKDDDEYWVAMLRVLHDQMASYAWSVACADEARKKTVNS